MQYSCHGKKGKCYLFHFCCELLFYSLIYASLYRNFIKLVNILGKHAANKQKRL